MHRFFGGVRYDSLIENSFRDLYQSVPVGFALNDFETGQFLRVNPAFCDIVGYTEEELLGMTYWDITPPRYVRDEHEQLKSLTRGSAYGPYEKEYYHKDGHEVPVMLSGVVLGHKPTTIWSVVQDASDRREVEDVIFKLAYYDPLTSLPNRAYFIEQATRILLRASADDQMCACLILDIDNFKHINDHMGYLIGDSLLKNVAEQLSECVGQLTELGNSNSFCARLGGDEFILLIDQIRNPEHAAELAEHLVKRFATSVDVDGRMLNATVSVGVSVFPTDGSNVMMLMKAADLALYSAKRYGKNQYFIHTSDIMKRFERFHEYENIVRYFVETEDFEIHFQPIYDLTKRRPVATEALFRGNKKFGPLDLGLLIQVAEETGLIVPLGTAIFRRACEYCRACTVMNPHRVVSINVSVRQLEERDFVIAIQDIISETGIDPSNVAIEITESMVMKESDEVLGNLHALRQLGISVFIDDFGKGYSSMTYLRHLPADKLKIDMEFIRDIDNDSTAVEIIRGINNLAHSLGLTTCAEGVETENQMKILTSLGVDQVQGYYISKPLPYRKLLRWLQDNYGDTNEA